MAQAANTINSSIGASNSGAVNTLTVTNPSNTASSDALVNVTVGGTSAGDAFQTFTVSGTTNWSQGVDNSASDAFVLAASTALGTTNVISAATGGAVSFPLGNVDVTKSASGADVSVTSSNTSNTSSSTATHYAIVGGTSAGDAQFQASVSGTTQWTWGIDNSVTSPTADPFVIAQGTALGTNNIMSVATSGEINYPLQPSFLAYLPSSDTNVTGNAATYTLGSVTALTEVFDRGTNFNTNGTFTAPVTGRYQLSVGTRITGCTIATTGTININTSNRGFQTSIQRPAGSTYFQPSLSVLADMDAADTFTCTILSLGEAGETDDILGSASPSTFMSGSLLC